MALLFLAVFGFDFDVCVTSSFMLSHHICHRDFLIIFVLVVWGECLRGCTKMTIRTNTRKIVDIHAPTDVVNALQYGDGCDPRDDATMGSEIRS